MERILRNTLLRQWCAQTKAPTNFDEFYNVVMGWCKTRDYTKSETTMSGLQALQADVASDDVFRSSSCWN